jgi:DnaJ-class molecular chaperone
METSPTRPSGANNRGSGEEGHRTNGQQPPNTNSKPCEKCGGTKEIDPPMMYQRIYGTLKFICDRCGGTGVEPRERDDK